MPWSRPYTSLHTVLVLLVGTTACDEVFRLHRDDMNGDAAVAPCGDGALAQDEDCDDSNTDGDDGCSATCRIEPGWVCPPATQVCLPVVGFRRGPVVTQLPLVGDPAATPPTFTFDCPATEVVVGFVSLANPKGDNLAGLQIVCGALAVTSQGQAAIMRATQSMAFGNLSAGTPLGASCTPDEVGTGYLPKTNTYVSGFRWQCQGVTHADGALRFGTPRAVDLVTSGGDFESLQSCPAGQIVTQVSGNTGASLGSMQLGCSELSAVICGDGVTTPPETCDDGNLLRFDGCDARCQREPS